MRRDDDDAAGLREVMEEAEHAVDLDVVEMRGRLVGEHERWIVRKCPCNRDALLLTARQVGGRWFTRSSSPTCSRSASARALASRFGTLPDCAAICTFSRAVRLGIKLNAWKTMPTVLRR